MKKQKKSIKEIIINIFHNLFVLWLFVISLYSAYMLDFQNNYKTFIKAFIYEILSNLKNLIQ